MAEEVKSSHFQSDGTVGKGSRDEIGLTLNDFQRKVGGGGREASPLYYFWGPE